MSIPLKIITKPRISVTQEATLLDHQYTSQNVSVTIQKGQSLTYVLILGISRARKRSLTITLKEGSSAKIFAVVIGTKSDEILLDITTKHAEPNTTAHISVKGLFFDSAKAKLLGTIVIPKGSIKTSAQLDERILLLSPTARAEAIPNLEIEADDVKASHAATVSRISQEELFYLQSRGLTHSNAMQLLIKGFINSQLEPLTDGKVRSKQQKAILRKIRAATTVISG